MNQNNGHNTVKIDEKSLILSLFKDNQSKQKIDEIFSIDLSPIPTESTLSQFQVEKLVLNRKEFCTDLMQFRHAKEEIRVRKFLFIDLYYQYKEAEAKILLNEGEIEDLQSNNQINPKIKEGKIKLLQNEIDKNKFRMQVLDSEAITKLQQAILFYNVYNKYKHFEDASKEDIIKLEEEGWRIKSGYYQELVDRQGITPEGILKFPHEDKGLQGLIEERSKFFEQVKQLEERKERK